MRSAHGIRRASEAYKVQHGSGLPVWLKSIVLAAEHRPHIRRVLLRGIEISVVAHPERQPELNLTNRQLGLLWERRGFDCLLQDLAYLAPHCSSLGHEFIKAVLGEHRLCLLLIKRLCRFKEAQLRAYAQVDHTVLYCRAHKLNIILIGYRC